MKQKQYLSMKKFTEMYLDYFNNFSTVQAFADHYEIDLETAQKILFLGNEISNIKV